MVTRSRLGEHWVAAIAPVKIMRAWFLATFGGVADGYLPVKLAGVDSNATDGSTMTSNPLGAAVGDDVTAMLDGVGNETTHAEGVVAHHSHIAARQHA